MGKKTCYFQGEHFGDGAGRGAVCDVGDHLLPRSRSRAVKTNIDPNYENTHVNISNSNLDS